MELLATLSGSPKRAPRRTGSAARGRRSWRWCRGRDAGVLGTQAGQGATAGEPSGRVEWTQQVSPQSGQSLGGVLIGRSGDRLEFAGFASFARSVLAEWPGSVKSGVADKVRNLSGGANRSRIQRL